MVKSPLNIITSTNEFIGGENFTSSLKPISSLTSNYLLADILKVKKKKFFSKNFFQASALFLLVLWTILANFLVFIVLYKNPRN
jgi:hypothetical protein